MTASINFAKKEHRSAWLHHPVIGDPSFDTIRRKAGNPVYTGEAPYEWPVNGFLTEDPETGRWHCYVGLYPETYIGRDGTLYGPALLLCSDDDGRSWENKGIVLQGDKDRFDGDGKQGGSTPDASIVKDGETWWMAYDWCKPKDAGDGGIAIARAASPEGPWERLDAWLGARPHALHPGNFRYYYEPTILRRKNDWLILTCMRQAEHDTDVCHYNFFNQALVALTAPNPEGPYGEPTVLLSPQSPCWLPQPIENCLAWTHDGRVYAPQYSVAANRTYQAVFSADIESAHLPEAWRVEQDGSSFHAIASPDESMGLWGQGITGFIDHKGQFQIMYPAKNRNNRGTINFASRPWDEPYQDGFKLSGANAPSLGLILRHFDAFKLTVRLQAETLEGVAPDFSIVWAHRAPLGPEIPGGDIQSTAGSHPERTVAAASLADCQALRVKGTAWSCGSYDAAGQWHDQASGSFADQAETFDCVVHQDADQLELHIGGDAVANFALPARRGAIGIIAGSGSYLSVDDFTAEGDCHSGTFDLLPLEGFWGSANRMEKWEAVSGDPNFRHGHGWISRSDDARVKWSFHGSAAKVWLPSGPRFGEVEVFLDGQSVATMDLHAETEQPSSPVWESADLETGHHSVMLLRRSGRLPVDTCEFQR